MSTSTPLLVTGASGKLGRRVLELLLEQGRAPLIAVTRNPDSLAVFKTRGVDVRAGDFENEGSLAAAFKGAERALLISTDAMDKPGRRLAQHRTAIRALAAAGVKHVVYTSIPNADTSKAAVAPDHAQTEAALKETKLDFTVLRNNIYIDLSLGGLAGAVVSGQLIDSKPNGAMAYVTREDCARAAAAALAASTTGRTTLDVTGPAAVTSDELAALLREVTGKKVVHVAVPLAALIDGMMKHGLPKPVAELYATFDVACEDGSLSRATDTVQKLTGKPPQSVREFLNANRAAFS